jgi:hypothetical protein
VTSQHSVVFAEHVRTAIGTFGGSLKDVPAPAVGARLCPFDRASSMARRSFATTAGLQPSAHACL